MSRHLNREAMLKELSLFNQEDTSDESSDDSSLGEDGDAVEGSGGVGAGGLGVDQGLDDSVSTSEQESNSDGESPESLAEFVPILPRIETTMPRSFTVDMVETNFESVSIPTAPTPPDPSSPSPSPIRISQNQASAQTSISQVKYVYGRDKKSPFKWQTTPNFDENTKFSLEFAPMVQPAHLSLTTIEQFFSLIFTNSLLSKIVDYTNIRIKLKSINVSPITINELKAFIGLLILFGLKKINHVSIHYIWSPKSIHWVPLATGTMSRKRFALIAHEMTFDDNRAEIRHEKKKLNSKFYKMEEIFNVFKINISNILIPSSNLCIDETLYACRARCAFIQFMKSKPAKYGIKFWCLVDVATNCQIAINIYLGNLTV